MQNRPPQLDPSSPILQRLRQFLKETGYFAAANFDLYGAGSRSALGTMLRLFFSREPVDAGELRHTLQQEVPSGLLLEELLETGFCRAEGEQIRANVMLQPYNDLLFAVGQLSLDRRPRSEERLMKISISSLEVANLIVPRHSRNSLDLGTGCGFLAALLSPTSERVFAVDLSPTAVRFAEFNARWNHLPNIACLESNLFAAVQHLRFDHIVSNPPFVICPAPGASINTLLYQHSGQTGDTFCIQIARDASRLLEENGLFQMMFSWLETPDQDWTQKLAANFSDLDCDVWAIRTSEQSAEEFIAAWCKDLIKNDKVEKSEVDSLRQQGRQYFEQHNFASVGTGLLTLRRCSSRPTHAWFDDAPDDRTEPYGSSVAVLLDVRERLGSLPDSALLQQRFTLASELATTERTVLHNGRWDTVAFEMNRLSGLKYSFDIADPLLFRIVTSLDGSASLLEVLERLSVEVQVSVAELTQAHLSTLRELLHFGFVLPA